MNKKVEAAPKKEKKAPVRRSTLLKVSKSIKCMAAMSAIAAVKKVSNAEANRVFRGTIRALGYADDSFKQTGRLVLSDKGKVD